MQQESVHKLRRVLALMQNPSRQLIYRIVPLMFFGYVTAFALYHSLFLYQYKDFYAWSFLFIYILLAFAVFGSKAIRYFLGRADARIVMAVIIIIAAVLRIWSMNSLPTQPIYDYAAYHKAALSVSHLDWAGLKVLEGKPWGYPLLLGLIYKVFGSQLAGAQYLNLLLSLISIWMIYLLGRKLMGPSYGLLAALFYGLLPSGIFMTNVVNSEILFITLLLGALYFSIVFMQDYSWKSLILSGLLFGLSQAVRPVGMIYLLVLAGFLFTHLVPGHLKSSLKYITVLLLSFYIALIPFMALKGVIYNQLILWEKGTFGMVLVMGTNVPNEGYWNEKDYDYIKSLQVKYHNNAEKVNKEAFKLGVWRLRSNPDFKLIVPNKIHNMWAVDTFGFEWANIGPSLKPIINHPESLRTYLGLSQIYYALILLFITATILCYHPEKEAGYRYLIAIILAFFIMHVFIEVQARYHMHITPLLVLLSIYGLFLKDDMSTIQSNE